MFFFSWFTSLFSSQQPKTSLTGIMNKEDFVSKDLFYQILDLDSSILLFYTKEDGWLGANKLFFSLFDYENIDDFRNRHSSVRELFEREAEEVFTDEENKWLDFIKEQKSDEGYRVVAIDKNGVERYIRLKVSLLKQKSVDLYLLQMDDVSELEHALSKTQEIEQLKTKFLANIGHEFRTPMNGILGFVELLEHTHPTESQHEYIHMIHSSARNLMTSIESLLDLSQMEGGRFTVNASEFNLFAEMEEMAQLYTSEGSNKGISVSFYVGPNLPTYIQGDLRKLKQILNNLINNALKFTPRGGKIAVETRLLKWAEGSRCTISFTVRDTGQGIAKEQIANVTKPFEAGDQADHRLGIGLSLSHGLVELLGGDLKIISEEGRGSQFNFTLSFTAAKEQSFQMVENKRAKVVLLDEKKIDDANLLTNYLRGFGLHIEKVHLLDETIYNDADMVYLVASQEQSAWLMKLGSYQKKCRVVLVLDTGEKLQTRTTHIVDYVINKPLLPTRIAEHVNMAFKLQEPEGAKEKLNQQGLRALVVEDNLINQRLISILLQEYDLKVSTASDGEEGVRKCQNQEFDIVFMDIDMPVKNGIIATKEIKSRMSKKNSMPIIALTALAMEGDRENILQEGLDDYLAKPLTRAKLEYILEKYLKVSVV
ncbi:response regulator [bacterium]|jgi:signal transduction histidine kinase/CheY-like chemotaxis protein|nr:response regulator [bacterium]